MKKCYENVADIFITDTIDTDQPWITKHGNNLFNRPTRGILQRLAYHP